MAKDIDKIMVDYGADLELFVEKILKEYRPALLNIEKDMFGDIVSMISEFDFKNGTEVDVASIVSEIDKIYINATNNPNFVKDTRSFLTNFDTVKSNALKLHKEISDLSYTPEFYEALNRQQKFLVDKTLWGLKEGGLKKYYLEDATQIVLEAAQLGYSQKQTERRLRNRLLSNPKKDSDYVRYATQISRDSVNQYNGQVNQIVQDEYKMDMIRYVGSLVDDSRPFCIHVRKELKSRIKVSELPALLDKFEGSNGMIKDTDEGNFYIVRGGWNCRHTAIPFRSITPDIE